MPNPIDKTRSPRVLQLRASGGFTIKADFVQRTFIYKEETSEEEDQE